MTLELNVQNDESSDSENEYDRTCPLWGIGGSFLSVFGTALTVTTLTAKDGNPHEISLKLAVGIVMIATGLAFCGTGILLARYGSFRSREPVIREPDSSEDVNEKTPFVVIEKRM